MPSQDEGDIQSIYLREVQRLYKRCYKFTQNQQDAEDALQIVFVHASRAERRPETRGEIIAWLNTIARNACLDLVRQRRGHLMQDLDENSESGGQSGWDRVADRTINVEERLGWKQLLQAGAAVLTSKERMAMELVHGDGFTRREAGLLLGLEKPYPFLAAAENKITKKIAMLAAEGDRNAKDLLRLLVEDETAAEKTA